MSLLEELAATAKRGTWQAIGRTVRDVARMRLNSQYDADFSAATEGAFFAWLEGGQSDNYRLLLVAPDDSINWSGLASLTVTDALTYLAAYTNTHSIPGWERFVAWFDDKFAIYGAYVTGVSICGRSAGAMPTYSNPQHSVSVWWTWLLSCAVNAGCSSVYLNGYKEGNYRYTLPMVIAVGGNATHVALDLILTI